MKNNSIKSHKIEGTPEAWENGDLGRSMQNARVAPPEIAKAFDDAVGMQVISIRLPNDLIEEFKVIADVRGIEYQPLMREVLQEYSQAEFRKISMAYAKSKIDP